MVFIMLYSVKTFLCRLDHRARNIDFKILIVEDLPYYFSTWNTPNETQWACFSHVSRHLRINKNLSYLITFKATISAPCRASPCFLFVNSHSDTCTAFMLRTNFIKLYSCHCVFWYKLKWAQLLYLLRWILYSLFLFCNKNIVKSAWHVLVGW